MPSNNSLPADAEPPPPAPRMVVPLIMCNKSLSYKIAEHIITPHSNMIHFGFIAKLYFCDFIYALFEDTKIKMCLLF